VWLLQIYSHTYFQDPRFEDANIIPHHEVRISPLMNCQTQGATEHKEGEGVSHGIDFILIFTKISFYAINVRNWREDRLAE